MCFLALKPDLAKSDKKFPKCVEEGGGVIGLGKFAEKNGFWALPLLIAGAGGNMKCPIPLFACHQKQSRETPTFYHGLAKQ